MPQGRGAERAELGDEPVRIVPYDPSWPARFTEEREQLAAALGDTAVGGIHHVGSTAVPGMDAKPIIDILVGVADLDSSRTAIPALARLDYHYAPYRSHEMHWFCKPDPAHRTHHLHLVPVGSRRYRDELAFRDFLIDHPDEARAYAALKRDLAARFRTDREAYTVAKSSFIEQCLSSAARQ